MCRRVLSLLAVGVILLGIVAPAAALDNASFEKEKLSPWETMVSAQHDEGPEAEVTLDAEIFHTGNRSLRLSGDAGTMKWHGVTQSMGVQAGRRYMLSGWIRTEDVRREARQYQNCGLLAQFLDRNGNIVKVGKYSAAGTPAVFGTKDWHQLKKAIQVPDGAVAAKIGCNLSMSGTAWFDDLSFNPLAEGDWSTLKTRRLVFHWEGDQKPSGEAIEKNEKGLEELESLLGVDFEGPHPVLQVLLEQTHRRDHGGSG